MPDVRQAATGRESLRRGAIAVVAYVAFTFFFAIFPFDGFSDELRGPTTDAISTSVLFFLLVPVTIVTARSIGLFGFLALPIAFIFVMAPIVPKCDGCSWQPAWVTLYGVAIGFVLPAAVIGCLAASSERRGCRAFRKVPLLVGLAALVVYAAFTLILAQLADVSLDLNGWGWIAPDNGSPRRDISAPLYLWITSITAIAVGYQLPWRFACLLPIVFALVTLEAQEPDLSSSAPWRALLFSIVVILPCSLLGTKLRQIADRRAIGANETTTGIAETEHGPPAADH